MAQYAAGDEAAFRELYGRYRARAYGYLSKRVSDPRLVDELFQQVFLKLHHSRAHYDGKRIFSAWFFTICRSTVIDELRRRGRTLPTTTMEEEPAAPQSESKEDSEPIPTGVLLALPERQREAVRLRYEEELAFDQIASRLNTTADNVRQLVSRGVKRLRKLLGKNR